MVVTTEWFLRRLQVFYWTCGDISTEENRLRLAQHIWGNLAQLGTTVQLLPVKET